MCCLRSAVGARCGHAKRPVAVLSWKPGPNFALEFSLLLVAAIVLTLCALIMQWAEPHNANGVTANTVIDSNDEPPKNNQQRMAARGY